MTTTVFRPCISIAVHYQAANGVIHPVMANLHLPTKYVLSCNIWMVVFFVIMTGPVDCNKMSHKNGQVIVEWYLTKKAREGHSAFPLVCLEIHFHKSLQFPYLRQFIVITLPCLPTHWPLFSKQLCASHLLKHVEGQTPILVLQTNYRYL